MKEIQKVVLSSAENTSYWWNMIIRIKVREIVIRGARNKNEYNFANIFMGFSERDWRRLYIELADLIINDINTFVPKVTICGTDAFSQDTDKGRHDRLNEELSKIVGKKVPDIQLSGDNYKDSVIFTNIFGVSIWYKSCGINDLAPECDPEYILTGDERELDFYYTLLSTMLVLTPDGIKSGSTQQLKQSFCTEYKKLNDLDDFDSVVEMFNKLFDIANDRKIIMGRCYEKRYSTCFREPDYAGLEEYIDIGKHYANIVLENGKDTFYNP